VRSGREELAALAETPELFKGYSFLGVYRRDFLLENELFQPDDLMMFEDVLWTPQVYFAARRVAGCAQEYYRYFRHGESATGSYGERTLRDAAEAIRRLAAFCANREGEMDDGVRRFFARHILSLLLMIFFHPSSVAKSNPARRRQAFRACLAAGETRRELSKLARFTSTPRRFALACARLARLPGMMWFGDLAVSRIYYRLIRRQTAAGNRP